MKENQNFNQNDFLNLLPEIVFDLDKDLNIQFLNNAGENILGFNKDELTNKKFIIEDFVASEDIERIKKNAFANFNGGNNSGNNYTVFNKNKEELTVEIYNSPIKKNGEIIGLRCIAIDITEKERNHKILSSQEKHYRQIFQNFPLPYQSLDTKGIILDVNPTWIETMQYAREEIIGKDFLSLVSEKDHVRFKDALKKFNNKGELSSVQFDLIKKNGSRIYINFHGKAKYSNDNKIQQFHCVLSDITLQRKAEQTLIESELKSRELNATKDKFFSIIAHDLKNPFNDLMGFTQLLSLNIHKYDKPRIEQFINIIHQSSKLAYNLLENLLDWSRSQTGMLKFNPEKISINAIIKENIELLGSMARSKSIKIYAELESDFYAFADQNMVRTVIRNLVSNAIKYTNQGGHINIVCSENKDKCEISVIDTGIGISEVNLSKILKIDESYTTSGTEKEKGTGLGLILCKEFIEKNKGRLLIKSKLDEGSTFTFTLPTPEVNY